MPTEMVRPLDAGWIWLETDSNLMHGSVLALFSPPPGAGDDFVDELTERMRSHRVPSAPFDRRLKPGRFSRLVPQWELVSEIDPDYHLRRVTLSAPGGQRELAQVVSTLHGTALDHSRPPWMVHVIDGLEDGRFAVLGQMHHALADGITALRIVDWWLSDDPKAQDVPPIWAFERPRRRSRRPGRTNPLRSAIAAVGAGTRGATGGLHAIRRTLTGLSARPWSAPGSAINGAITARRRVATQSFEMERFRTLSECTGGTINDVVLAVCAGGLRAYLEEIGQLPERPLVTNMPVSVRREDSEADVGNAISWAMLALATDIDDVRERFEAIRAATVQAKQRLRAMPPSAVDAYTLLAVSPILAEQLLRVGGRVPPLFNVPISNVPGPRDRLFLDGAALDELHALTVIYDGYGLVIVAVSYGDRLQMSFTACPDTLPHSQHLALHCGRALEELEATYRAVGPRSQWSGRVTVPPRQDGPVDRP